MKSQGPAEQGQAPTTPDGVSLLSGTLQSSPATTSPSGSLSGSQDDSDSDMAFSVNQSSSASESSLGKEGQTLQGVRAGSWLGSFLGLSKAGHLNPLHPLLPQLEGGEASRCGIPKGDTSA